MVGQNTSLSNSEIRGGGVSQTAHEAHTLREARRKVQIGTGCIALPALGFSSSALICEYCSWGQGSLERLFPDNSATHSGLEYVYCFSRQFKRKKTYLLGRFAGFVAWISR
jgi:hypothetical protein